MTRDLAPSDKEQRASQFSIAGMTVALIVTGLATLALSQADVPSAAKGVLIIGLLFGCFMLMTGVASAMRRRASHDGDDAPAARPAAPAAPRVAAAPASAPAAEVGQRPAALAGPRDGGGDDLTLIKGVGPKLAELCNTLGFYHFDQIAAWTADEVAWVDENLEGFKGRVSRDDWVAQAKILASGGETEFSSRQ